MTITTIKGVKACFAGGQAWMCLREGEVKGKPNRYERLRLIDYVKGKKVVWRALVPGQGVLTGLVRTSFPRRGHVLIPREGYEVAWEWTSSMGNVVRVDWRRATLLDVSTLVNDCIINAHSVDHRVKHLMRVMQEAEHERQNHGS